jgi:hypothetical protein
MTSAKWTGGVAQVALQVQSPEFKPQSHQRKKNGSNLCPLKGKWINKVWCICLMEYYSASKKKGILIYNTVKINIEQYAK